MDQCRQDRTKHQIDQDPMVKQDPGQKERNRNFERTKQDKIMDEIRQGRIKGQIKVDRVKDQIRQDQITTQIWQDQTLNLDQVKHERIRQWLDQRSEFQPDEEQETFDGKV